MTTDIDTVAIVGCGLIGSGWAIVYANAGLAVRLYDADPQGVVRARDMIAHELAEMAKLGLCGDPEPVVARITGCDDLSEAVGMADYVQESVRETVEAKTKVCAEIDACLPDHAILGSSSSGIPASDFTRDMKSRTRCFIVHPVNPPHLIPLVEIVPAPWSDPALIAPLRTFLERVGQTPILVEREIEGFVLNRLQGALLNEAFALFDEGYASAADIDLAVSHGLGTRWSFMGPFETIDLNAPQGIADYAARLAPLYTALAASRGMTAHWSDDAVGRATAERRAALSLDDLGRRSAWRNARLMDLAARRRRESDPDSVRG